MVYAGVWWLGRPNIDVKITKVDLTICKKKDFILTLWKTFVGSCGRRGDKTQGSNIIVDIVSIEILIKKTIDVDIFEYITLIVKIIKI